MRFFSLLNTGSIVEIPNVTTITEALDAESVDAIFTFGEEFLRELVDSGKLMLNQRQPRVLVTVSGGVADFVKDDEADVIVFDWDNYEASSEQELLAVPKRFADLAEQEDIPVNESDAESAGESTFEVSIYRDGDRALSYVRVTAQNGNDAQDQVLKLHPNCLIENVESVDE